MVEQRAGGDEGDDDGGDGGDVPWRQILKDLRSGKPAEIPFSGPQDLGKKRRQLTRRAERHGMAVEITPGDNVLVVRRTGELAPDPAAVAADNERRERRRAARGGQEGGAE
jgi:hypothetical protein